MNKRTIKEWVWQAPEELLAALSSVPVLNSLREHRNRNFQMQGMYDGAMSAGCKSLCNQEYKALDELISALEDR